jgi:hypothetical protein
MKQGKTHTTVVTATDLAAHLFCSREAVARFEKQHVLERLPAGGYDLDECRRRVLEHLRQRKPQGEYRDRYQKAHALREERKAALEARELCLMSDFETAQDTMTALMFAALDAAAVRLHPRDIEARRRVQQEHTILKECMSIAFSRLADDLTADPVTLMPNDIAAIRARLFPNEALKEGKSP